MTPEPKRALLTPPKCCLASVIKNLLNQQYKFSLIVCTHYILSANLHIPGQVPHITGRT